MGWGGVGWGDQIPSGYCVCARSVKGYAIFRHVFPHLGEKPPILNMLIKKKFFHIALLSIIEYHRAL